MAEAKSREARREEARRAMEDEARAARRTEEGKLLAKRRRQAMLSMEGEERRRRREASEKKRRGAETAAEAAAETKVREATAKRAAVEVAARNAAEHQAAIEAARAKRLKSAAYAEKLVSSLKKEVTNLSPLRTLKSDMARAVKEEGISIARIAISQQTKGRLAGQEDATKSSGRKIFFLTAMIAILGLGTLGTALWWHYHPSPGATLPGTATLPTPLIFAEDSQPLTFIATTTVSEAQQAITQAINNAGFSTPSPQIKNLYPVQDGQALNWPTFRQLTGLALPDNLNRSLENQFMLGVYGENGDRYPFLVLTDKYYEQTLSGLLIWEPTLTANLQPLWPTVLANLTSTSTVWRDQEKYNKVLRVLREADGRVVLLYGFLDPAHLVITTGEPAFAEIFKRFTNSGR